MISNAEPSALADCLASRPAKLRLSADKVARLLATGRTHMAGGRITDARIVFKRAADACDAYAAFALGASYDPTLLQKLGLSSPTSGRDEG